MSVKVDLTEVKEIKQIEVICGQYPGLATDKFKIYAGNLPDGSDEVLLRQQNTPCIEWEVFIAGFEGTASYRFIRIESDAVGLPAIRAIRVYAQTTSPETVTSFKEGDTLTAVLPEFDTGLAEDTVWIVGIFKDDELLAIPNFNHLTFSECSNAAKIINHNIRIKIPDSIIGATHLKFFVWSEADLKPIVVTGQKILYSK